jgi:hypothetical protein
LDQEAPLIHPIKNANMASKPEDTEGLTESLSKASIKEEPPASKPDPTQTASTSVPDPDEDDLDDLDGMLLFSQ